MRVGDHEVAHVVAEHLGVHRHDVAGRPAGRVPPDLPQHRDAGDEHRERREHERRAEDRPDADAVRRLGAAAGQDRDDRDHRLRQRGADRGEHGADRALGKLELPAEPLDAVREQLRAEQDDDERNDEDQDVHDARSGFGGEGDARRDHDRIRPARRPSSARRVDVADERDDDAGDGVASTASRPEPDEAGRLEGDES